MPDAGLTFNIDSSQAQRAVAVLDALKTASAGAAQGQTQAAQGSTQLSQAYAQQRDRLAQLVQETRGYDGTLQGLIGRLDQLRDKMTGAQQAFDGYQASLVRATAAATTFFGDVQGLDRYVAKLRELRNTQTDIATGFSNISQALNNATVQGFQIRYQLQQLGVRTNDLQPGQTDVLLQRLADQARRYRDSPATLQAFQAVLGPTFSQQQLTALGAQPYVTYQQQIERERQTAARSQIDSQQAAIQRLTSQLQRNEAERSDLASRYSLSPTFAGRLGFDTAAIGISSDEQLRRLRAIQNLPEDQRRQYETFGFRISRAIDESYPARAIRNFTSGTYSSNADEIAARAQADRASSSWGLLYSFPREVFREGLNIAGLYNPLLNRDTRQMSPAERLFLQQQNAGILANVGDSSLQGVVNADQAFNEFNTEDVRKRYRQSFGNLEGERRFRNQFAQLQQNRLYAKAPEQAVLDEAARQRLISSLPLEQRAAAQYALQFIGQQAGSAATVLPPGTSAEALFSNPNLSRAQQTALQTGFQTQVQSQLSTQSLQTQRQIDFQRELAQELTKGRAAAEDYTRAWGAYIAALDQGATKEQAEVQRQEALKLAQTQRVTQGQALLTQQKQDNQFLDERIKQAERLANADPITRQAASLLLGINQDRRGLVAGGGLPSDRTAEGARVQAQYDYNRQVRVGEDAVDAAQKIRDTTQDNLRDQKAIADLMQEQGISAQRATEIVQNRKQFEQEIAAAQASGKSALMAQVDAQLRITDQLQQQLRLEQQRQQNLETARQANQAAAGNLALAGLPPELRELGGQILPLFTRQFEAGGQRISLTPDMLRRGSAFERRLMNDPRFGFSPQGAAVASSFALAESGARSINERHPVGGRGGFGYFQWTGPRRQEFEQFAAARGLDLSSEDANLQFFLYDLRAHHPQMLSNLRNPSLSVDQQGANFQSYTTGNYAPLVRQVPARIDLAHRLYAASGGAAGGGMPPEIGRILLQATQGGQLDENSLRQQLRTAGLAPDQIDALLQAVQGVRARYGTQQVLTNAEEETQSSARLGALQRQYQLIIGGQPGLAARVTPVEPGPLGEERAGRAAAQVQAGQRNQGAAAIAGTAEEIQQATRTTAAYNKSVDESAAAVARLNAQLQAEKEAQQLGADVVDVASRAHQILADTLAKEGEQIAQRSQGARAQIEDQKRLTEAAGQSSEALMKAEASNRAASEERLLQGLKRNETDQATIRVIDQLIDRLHQQTEAEKDLGIQQARTEAAGRGRALRDQNFVSEAELARGPFASSQDLRRTRANAELANYFRENPSLVGTPEGNSLIQRTNRQQDLADMADELSTIRESAHETQGALEGFLSNVATGSEKASTGLQQMGRQLEQIGLKQFVFKPLEQLTDKLLTLLFGGTPNGGPGGTGAGTGGAGGSLIDKIFGSLTGGGGGGGGGPTVASGGASLPALLMAAAKQMQTGGNAGDSNGGSTGSPSFNGGFASSPGGGSSGSSGGLFSQALGGLQKIFQHPGGLTGSIADAIGGNGFYQNGGLIGSLFGGSTPTFDPNAAGSFESAFLPSSPIGFGAADALPTFDASAAGSFESAFSFLTSARGNVFPRSVLADYDSQVVVKPTYFRFAKGVGLMGEAGPEAIMPLRRGPDGNLGVAMHSGGSSGGPAVVINQTIHTPDAHSFGSSRGQIQGRAFGAAHATLLRNSTGG